MKMNQKVNCPRTRKWNFHFEWTNLVNKKLISKRIKSLFSTTRKQKLQEVRKALKISGSWHLRFHHIEKGLIKERDAVFNTLDKSLFLELTMMDLLSNYWREHDNVLAKFHARNRVKLPRNQDERWLPTLIYKDWLK